MHVLSDHFVRIRYYGLLANAQPSKNPERCRVLLQVPSPEKPDGAAPETWQKRLERLTGIDPTLCLVCGDGRLLLLELLPRKTWEQKTSEVRTPPKPTLSHLRLDRRIVGRNADSAEPCPRGIDPI